MSDFSVYSATQFANWMSQGTVNTPPTDLYVAVFDDTNTERSGDFVNGRVQTTTGTDWNIINTNDFENANLIDFGEASTDVNNLQDIALFDAASGGNEIARYQLADALFDVSEGTILQYAAGEIDFDVVDRTE